MLIEQIIEFESMVSEPLVVHVFLKQVIFITKQNSRATYLMLKMLQKAI